MGKSWRPQIIDGVPDRVIVIDGVCVLCSAAARFVIARDPDASFRFVTVQEPYGLALAQRLGIDTAFPETNAAILGGRAYFKSDAAIEVLSHLPRWRWARGLRIVPRAVRNAIYDLVARNRYRLFGRTATCLVPTPELARHFLRGGAAPG
jgi:predicted DCC family thiol-disulfide oxidoreductase YuxK